MNQTLVFWRKCKRASSKTVVLYCKCAFPGAVKNSDKISLTSLTKTLVTYTQIVNNRLDLSRRLREVSTPRKCLKAGFKQHIKSKEFKLKPTSEEASIRRVSMTLTTFRTKIKIKTTLDLKKSLKSLLTKSPIELKKLCSLTKSSMCFRMTLKCSQMSKQLLKAKSIASRWLPGHSVSRTTAIRRECHVLSSIPIRSGTSTLPWVWLSLWSSMKEPS